jgi:hypothetical protein
VTVELLLALGAEYEQNTPTGWMKAWGSDAAYRRVQSLARNVRDPILGYRGRGAFTNPYIDPRPNM